MTVLSDHCECSHPMTYELDYSTDPGGLYPGGGNHDPERETEPGLAKVLDEHHRPLLCGMCDGTESFDVQYHFGIHDGTEG